MTDDPLGGEQGRLLGWQLGGEFLVLLREAAALKYPSDEGGNSRMIRRW